MNTILSLGLLGGVEIILILGLLPTILLVWALIDLIKSEFADNIVKLIWALAIIFLPLLGPLLYLLIGRGQKVRLT